MTVRQKIFEIYKKCIRKISGHGLLRFSPFKIVNNFIVSNLKSNFSEIQGSKMYLDSLFRDISVLGVWEPLQTEIVKKIIKNGNIVLDLGANIGYYTLILSKLVGNEGKVYSFEPDPKNFALLKKNIEINNYQNILFTQKAISNKKGTLRLYLSTTNPGDHRIFNVGDNRNFIEIESIRLDDWLDKLQDKINFIKIDIQGAEGKAIEGMTTIIQKSEKLNIITEFWPYGLIKLGTKPENFLKALTNYGFIPYEIKEQENKLMRVKVNDLLKNYSTEIGYSINLFWTKDEKLANSLMK